MQLPKQNNSKRSQQTPVPRRTKRKWRRMMTMRMRTKLTTGEISSRTSLVTSEDSTHCSDLIILPGRQNWQQIIKNLPKSHEHTVWNGKMWLGKIQTTRCNILPRQNSPAPAVKTKPAVRLHQMAVHQSLHSYRAVFSMAFFAAPAFESGEFGK